MLIQQIDQNDGVIINLLREDEFHSVSVEGAVFCVHARYQRLKYVGSGSQGIVCSAFDTVLMQTVAIKKITNPFANLEDAKRAYRELKVLKMVNYKYIIELQDAFITSTNHQQFAKNPEPVQSNLNEPNKNSPPDSQADESPDVLFTNSTESNQNDLYLVMEYIEMNLSQLVPLRLDHERVSYLVYQMFCALNYLHDASIIHRDLKPSNIAVKKDCSIKILDFGLARTENEYMMSPYVQTRYYRAPELVLDLDSYSSIVDVWSIGCIMGELIAGQVLFPGANSIDQWEKIVDLLGTPDESFVCRLPANVANFIRKRPRNGLDFEAIFPDSMFVASGSPSSLSKRNELARDLLSRMLVIDPAQRITIEQALLHDYLKIWLDKDDFNHPRASKLDELIDKDYESIEAWQELINKEIKNYSFY